MVSDGVQRRSDRRLRPSANRAYGTVPPSVAGSKAAGNFSFSFFKPGVIRRQSAARFCCSRGALARRGAGMQRKRRRSGAKHDDDSGCNRDLFASRGAACAAGLKAPDAARGGRYYYRGRRAGRGQPDWIFYRGQYPGQSAQPRRFRRRRGTGGHAAAFAESDFSISTRLAYPSPSPFLLSGFRGEAGRLFRVLLEQELDQLALEERTMFGRAR